MVQGVLPEDWMSTLEPTMEQQPAMFPQLSAHISAPQLSFQGLDVDELGLPINSNGRGARRSSLNGTRNTGYNNDNNKAVWSLPWFMLPLGANECKHREGFLRNVQLVGFLEVGKHISECDWMQRHYHLSAVQIL